MAIKENISFNYNTITRSWINSIGNVAETPEHIREIISGSNFAFPTFPQLLFRTMITSYPCDIALRLIDIVKNSKDLSEAAEKGAPLLNDRASAFTEYCKTASVICPENIEAFVYAFLNENCRSKDTKICHRCSCRRSFASGMSDKGLQDRSLDRNISNWLSGKSIPKERETCIAMCYALNLRIINDSGKDNDNISTSFDANRFLTVCCGRTPLQPSDPSDASHYFCLHMPMGKPLPIGEHYDGYGNYLYSRNLYRQLKESIENNSCAGEQTVYLKDRILGCSNEAEFLELASRSGLSDTKTYNTARLVIDRILKEYKKKESFDLLCGIKEDSIKPPRKGACKAAINAICDCDRTAFTDPEMRRFFSENQVEDILFYSKMLQTAAKPDSKIRRELFLLALMVEDYFIDFKKDPTNRCYISDSASSGFASFVNRINTTLIASSFAPLNPHNPFDFCILFAYHLIEFDETDIEIDDCLSYYLLKAIDKMLSLS